ncbi:MAG: iron-regulated protein [Myxococcales bacterium]|nr:iron-regulated protein [Myxococcales bacterium]
MKITTRIPITLLSLFVVAGCGEAGGLEAFSNAQLTAVKQRYASVVYSSYKDSLDKATALKSAIDAFLAAPSAAGLDAAKAAWLDARTPYGQTEVYRFYGGPIDDDKGPEGQINAWPMDENYIDYVEGKPDAGIINNPTQYPTIDKATLVKLNEAGGTSETAISTGYHAIEFLLWGQDLSATGPGARSYEDYLTTQDATAPNGDRRAAYLAAVGALLVDDLQSLVDAWAEGADNYRTTFVALPPHVALNRMLTGMGVLSKGELAGQRISVALQTKDQEDEHSCFSDNTHNDIILNATGVENVYLGRWASETGDSLSMLVARLDPALDERIRHELAASITAAKAIPAPFDAAIADDSKRPLIQATVDALQKQADSIVDVAALFGNENLNTDIDD